MLNQTDKRAVDSDNRRINSRMDTSVALYISFIIYQLQLLNLYSPGEAVSLGNY